VSTLEVADVWSGHPVGFALVTQNNQQFAAFYDANRRLTVATRTLDANAWTFATLPTSVVWDSHNYIAMAIDSAGFLHVSGNMHSAPLIYFRSTRPLDITSFAAAPMVGMNETSCTYPQFIHGPAGDFVYAYRDGVSGAGNYVFNIYDVPTQTWRRLISTPLADGQGLRNAYPVGPTLGPDGFWHLVYVWRETPDASTNHDLSYARSRDLSHWETGTGQPLTLPITLATSDIVDPVPVNGGMINNNTKVGFDSQNRPVVAYHKYDAAGNTQLYNARVENGHWTVHQTSTWNTRWTIGGGGTLIFQIELEGVKADASGALTQVWYNAPLGGWNAFRVDETTLAAVATIGRLLPYPAALDQPQSPTAGMGVRWASDSGAGTDPGIHYMLRWETLAENNDLPRAVIPPPTKLRLYGFSGTP
jgi:BNR repeat-containing family member